MQRNCQALIILRQKHSFQVPFCCSFDDVYGADPNFFHMIMTVTDKIAPYRNKRLKGNTKKWFDREVLEQIEC